MSESNEPINEFELKDELFAEQIKAALEEDKKVGNDVKEEGTSEQNVPTSDLVPELSEEEKQAVEMGWDPNYEGPNPVSAHEFIRVGQLIEAKRDASKRAKAEALKVEELSRKMDILVEHNKKLAELQHRKELDALNAQRLQKIQEGDLEAVQQIERKQMETQAEFQKVATPSQNSTYYHPSVLEWEKDNSFWLKSNDPNHLEMKQYLAAQAEYYNKYMPNIDPEVAVKKIDAALKAQFPDNYKKTEEVIAPKAHAPKIGASRSAKSSVSFSSFSADEKILFEQVRRADPKFTPEQFSEMYLTKRKS